MTASGYDQGFLGVPVPLDPPGVRLDYPRFTVWLDTARRLARLTAVTIDGGTLRALPRTGDWFLDERVPAASQAGPEVYARDDLDRGHLVRRRDPGWGEPAAAAAAMAATFAYPNAAPQVAGFNQSRQLWLGLEDHVLAYAEATAQRIIALTAPVLAEDDPPYRGIRVPRRFLKVAAWADAGGLRSAGFALDQTELLDLRTGVLAAPPLGGFRTFQAPVADLAALSGLDLGPLVAADVLGAAPVRAGAPWMPLHAASDIRLA